MRHGGWIKFYMLGSFLIKMQAARLATFIKSITCKTLTPSSRPLKVHWKYWSFVALKSDSSSQHPIVSHLWLFPLSSLWHYFLLFPSACSNQANFVITTILPVNQDIIFETKLFFWFEKSVFVLWGIKWWLLSVHTSAVNDLSVKLYNHGEGFHIKDTIRTLCLTGIYQTPR